VASIHAYGSHWMFYVLFGVLAAIYAASLAALASQSHRQFRQPLSMAVFFALLTLLHSRWLLDLFSGLLPGGAGMAPAFKWMARLATHGVAAQQVFEPILQPSLFGVLLVTSIALFCSGRESAAVATAVLAATIHPTYVLHAGVLTMAGSCLADWLRPTTASGSF
jgi:hypothetical protein